MKKQFILLLIALGLLSCENEQKNLIFESIATADASYQDYTPDKLTDTLLQTMWNSGSRGQHWINFNYKHAIDVSKIGFVINVDTTCIMDYTILAKLEGATDYSNLETKNILTKDLDSFIVNTELKNVSDVKIVLTNNTTWPCIRSVQIIGN
jgi:hypothetical protein